MLQQTQTQGPKQDRQQPPKQIHQPNHPLSRRPPASLTAAEPHHHPPPAHIGQLPSPPPMPDPSPPFPRPPSSVRLHRRQGRPPTRQIRKAAGSQGQEPAARKQNTHSARPVKQDRKPSLEEIAEEALVSRKRCTATSRTWKRSLQRRHSTSLFRDPRIYFAMPPRLIRSRVQLVDTTLHDIILANEASLRIMLAHSLERAIGEDPRDKRPVRQNLEHGLNRCGPHPRPTSVQSRRADNLSKALALIIGTEGMIVIKDVLQLNDADARKVKRWAIRSLIEVNEPARE